MTRPDTPGRLGEAQHSAASTNPAIGVQPARPTIGSLCTGYGGLDLAVAAHYGARVVWHAEYDKHAATVADRHWPGTPNLGDITSIRWEEVVPPDTPAVDIVTAGYP